MKETAVETKPQSAYQKTSFSCQKTLLKHAKRLARRNRRSLSAHIQFLIERDLKSQEAEPATA